VPAWITTDTYIGNVNWGGGGGRRRGRSRMSPASTVGVDAARLRRAHTWLHAKEAAQRALYNRMRSVAATLRLPSTTPAHAHQTYVDAANAGISFRGRGRDTVVVATTLAALRRLGAPQPHLREVRPLVRNMRATLRLYRRITEALSTRGGGNPNADTGADGNGGGSSSSIGGGSAGTLGGMKAPPPLTRNTQSRRWRHATSHRCAPPSGSHPPSARRPLNEAHGGRGEGVHLWEESPRTRGGSSIHPGPSGHTANRSEEGGDVQSGAPGLGGHTRNPQEGHTHTRRVREAPHTPRRPAYKRRRTGVMKKG